MVPEAERFIPPGEPKFPLQGIAEHAIASFADPDPEALKDLVQYPIPWVAVSSNASIGTGARPRRHATITNGRILEHGMTADCMGCLLESGYHSKACRDRSDALYLPKSEPKAPLGLRSFFRCRRRRRSVLPTRLRLLPGGVILRRQGFL